MGTVDKDIAEQIIANDGYGDPGDPRTVKIVRYTGYESQELYGAVLIVEVMIGMGDRYERPTEYVRNPKVIWTAEKGRIE
jgi:hypothetical protein